MFWAAKALKAKILMQKGDMAAAKPILKDVIENGKTSNGLAYGLEDDLDANFSSYTENGKESIFAVQFSVDTNNNGNVGMSTMLSSWRLWRSWWLLWFLSTIKRVS